MEARRKVWQRVWLTCVFIGACWGLGGGAMRSVVVFSLFRPFTVELNTALPAEARLQGYRIAAEQTPYVWAGLGIFLLGVGAMVGSMGGRLRTHGWLFMALVLAVVAVGGELWLALVYDIPVVRLSVVEPLPMEQIEELVVRRVREAGVVATMTALCEWTILLLFVWRPLEQEEP